MEAYFRILDLPIRIRSNSRQFLHDFGNIFYHFKVSRGDCNYNNSNSFHVSINHTCSIAHENHVVYKTTNYQRALEYLEYEIYQSLINRLNRYYLIHAGVIANNNWATLLPAKSGGGKTTVVAGMIKNGFKYLTDEIAVIHPRTLMVHPFPRPLNMKIGSLHLFRVFEPEMELINKSNTKTEGKIHHVLVSNDSIHPVDRPIPVRCIIFVEYTPGAECRPRQISRARTIFEIVKSSFNQYLFKEEGIALLDRLVRTCECYQLPFNQLDEAVELVKNRITCIER